MDNGGELTRRALLQRGLGAGGAALLLGACGGSGDGGGAAGTPAKGAGGVSSKNFYAGQEPQRGGVLRYAMPGGSPADTMDPAKGTPSPQTFYYSYALYDRLWRTTPDTYEIVPMLVDEAEHNADGTVWTIRLKAGIELHDGRALRPEDVIASMRRMLDPKLASGRAGQLKTVDLGRTRKVDDRTLRVVLDVGQITFPESMAQFVQILPADFDPRRPVGTGPFKLKSFTPGQQASFVRNENYWDGRGAHLDELVITNFQSPTAVANALQAGQVEMGNIAYELTRVLAGKPGVHLQSFLVYGYAPFRMRVDAGALADKRVRQALRFAADREAMVNQAYLGQGKVANDQYAAQDPDFNHDLPKHGYDPERARSLLEQAGHSGLRIVLNACELVPGMVSAATVYARQAKAAGIDVQVRKLEVPAFFGPSYPQYTFATEYRSTANYLLSAALNDGPTSTQNLTRFDNAEYERLYMRALGEFDAAKRRPLIHRMQEIQHEEGGYLIWGFNNQLKAYRNVGGIVPDIGALPPHWHELWLAKT